MKIIIQILLFTLVVNCLSAQVNCTLEPQYLDNNKDEVLKAWENAGTNAFNDAPIKIEDGIRADDPGILPWGQYINELITSKPCEGYYYIYFPAGTYYIYETLLIHKDKIILKGDGADPYDDLENTTRFVFCHEDGTELECINISGDYCGIDDIAIKNVICESDIGTILPKHFINNTLYYTANHITGLNIQITDSQGKLMSSGDAEISKAMHAKYKYSEDLDENELYTVQATFFFGSQSKTEKHFVTVDNSKLLTQPHEGTLDEPYPVQNKKTTMQGNKEKGEGHTIRITGNNNWVRGVYSEYTQKMHVYISGESNTVTGCYFTDSWDYGTGGYGYGVCLSSANKNLVENNVLFWLRHGIVCQYTAKLNVIAYNSSYDMKHGGDILLHCNEDDAVGPMLNLFEGNIVERAKVDMKGWWPGDFKWHNDKFNTYFRNRTIYDFQISKVKKKYKARQCGQNVVGCNMNPHWDPWHGNTFHKIKNFGYRKYWNRWKDWEDLPSDQISYFKQSTPDYFSSGFDWPFVPARKNVTPARDRLNQYFSNDLSPAVFQGLDDYDLACCPDIMTCSGETWNNVTEEFKAMDEIIIDNCEVVTGNNLTFKAGSKITLTSGTHIHAGNIVQIFYTNDICDWDDKEVFKDSNAGDKNAKIGSDTELANQIRIYPNPNNGTFMLDTKLSILKENIQIYDLMGRKLEFTYSNQSVNLIGTYTGVVILRLSVHDEIVIKRITLK